ncbi:Protein FAR1-RELATED SEQUENCE 2 [Bienertia sinuspersici]
MLGEKYIRNPVTRLALELYFRKIYTDAKYVAFQKEYELLFYCYHMSDIQIGEKNKVLFIWEDRVWKYCKGGLKQYVSDDRRILRVKFNSVTLDIECECKLFETHDILCHHCIKIFDMNHVNVPPEKTRKLKGNTVQIRRHLTKNVSTVGFHMEEKDDHWVVVLKTGYRAFINRNHILQGNITYFTYIGRQQ